MLRISRKNVDPDIVVLELAGRLNEEQDRREMQRCWEQCAGDLDGYDDDIDFIRGFSDGALSVWNDVKGKI